jgi:diguanylate cyclase (GGDEF)-like protein
MKTNVLRFATYKYLGALSLIACLSIGTHFLIESVVAEQGTAARVINMAGRQRMLSQRIAEEALELHYATGSDRARVSAALHFDIDRMEASNAALAHGNAALGIPAPATPALRAIFEERPFNVERRVQTFVEVARSYADASNRSDSNSTNVMKGTHGAIGEHAGDPLLRQIVEPARDVLLTALDTAVTQYQADSDATVRKLHTLLQGALVLMLFTLVAEAVFLFRPMFRQLKSTQLALLDAARTDPLTGSMNRRHLFEQGEDEIAHCIEENTVLSILVLDIDNFKSVNDRFGHPVGDRAIQTVVRCMLSNIGEHDHLGRVGGEEFMIVCPGSGQQEAMLIAENIRKHIETTVIHCPAGDFTLTASIGVAQWRREDGTLMPAIDRADKALYLAKRNGRNRVEQNEAEGAASISAGGQADVPSGVSELVAS